MIEFKVNLTHFFWPVRQKERSTGDFWERFSSMMKVMSPKHNWVCEGKMLVSSAANVVKNW